MSMAAAEQFPEIPDEELLNPEHIKRIAEAKLPFSVVITDSEIIVGVADIRRYKASQEDQQKTDWS